MRKLLLSFGLIAALFGSPVHAADSTVSAMTAASALGGTELLYVVQGAADRKGTALQFAAYMEGLASGDCTYNTGTHVITCTKTNGSAFATIATSGSASDLSAGTLPAGRFPALTGDVTTVAGALAATLKNTGPGATGPLGSATVAPIITIDAQGRVTALTSATVTPAVGSVTGLGTGVATWLATPSSANLFTALTTKNGSSGNVVFSFNPTLTSPVIATGLTLGYATGAGTQCLQGDNTGVVTGTGAACGGSGSTGANPTATASDTAVNGVATTFMRSDGAPAIQKTSSSVFGLAKVDGTTITASAGVISAVGGSGTVTSVSAGCGTSTGGSPITTTGSVLAALTRRANATTSDTIVAADCGNLLTESNAGSIAVAIAQAGTTGFAAGTYFDVCTIGAGTATITPTTSTIGGASTLAIPGGTAAAPVCYLFQSDGTNYNIVDGPTINAGLLSAGTLLAARLPALTGDVTSSAGSAATTLAAGSASNLNSGTLAAARGGAGTITGALKGNGAGVVSQAACADLSNGTTGCSTATGTSGATLPLLNGTNTWSGTQTFGTVNGAITTQSGTTYTLTTTDCGTMVRFTNAAAVTVTIPATFTAGCNIAIEQTTSAGQVTMTGTAVSAATLHSAHSYTKTFGQWAIIGISIESTGVAILTGDGA